MSKYLGIFKDIINSGDPEDKILYLTQELVKSADYFGIVEILNYILYIPMILDIHEKIIYQILEYRTEYGIIKILMESDLFNLYGKFLRPFLNKKSGSYIQELWFWLSANAPKIQKASFEIIIEFIKIPYIDISKLFGEILKTGDEKILNLILKYNNINTPDINNNTLMDIFLDLSDNQDFFKILTKKGAVPNKNKLKFNLRSNLVYLSDIIEELNSGNKTNSISLAQISSNLVQVCSIQKDIINYLVNKKI